MNVHISNERSSAKSSPRPSCSEIFSEDSDEYSRSPCLDVINTPEHAGNSLESSADHKENRGFVLSSNGCDSGIIRDLMETPPPIKIMSNTVSENPISSELTDGSGSLQSRAQTTLTSAFLSPTSIAMQPAPAYHHNVQHYQSISSQPHPAVVSNFHHSCNICPAYEPCLCMVYNGYVAAANGSGITATSSPHHPRYDFAAAVAAQSQHNFQHYHHQPQQHGTSSLHSYHSHSGPLNFAAAYTSLYQNIPQTRTPRIAVTGSNCQNNYSVFPGGFGPSDSYASLGTTDGIETEGIDSIVHSTVESTEIEEKNETMDEEQSTSNCGMKNFIDSLKPNSRLQGPKNKPLNEVAVRLMETWYLSHEDEPYPSYDQKELLANGGSITIAQVNSWFANRRNRSDNTKPKKNKKQLELRLIQFGMELENATNGCLNGYDLARRIIRIVDEFLV